MRVPLALVMLAVARCVGPSAHDAGSGTGGGSGGASGGGAGGGAECIQLPGCSCGSGGGSVYRGPYLVIASRGGPDAGSPSVQAWDGFDGLMPPATFGVPQPLLAGVPVSLASTSGGVIALKAGSQPAQMWSGHLLGCDRPVPLGDLSSAGGQAALLGSALWFVDAPGNIVRVPISFGVPASPVTFPALSAGFASFAYDTTNDRLFAGGDGVEVWSGASTHSGDAGSPSFQLTTGFAVGLDVAGDRLYASGRAGDVRVWSNLGGLTGPRVPDFSLDAGASARVRHQQVSGGNLVLTVDPGRVVIYRNIGAATASRAPDVVVDHPSLADARKAQLTGRDVLLVLTADGVVAFRDATTAPAFSFRVDVAQPTDFVYFGL